MMTQLAKSLFGKTIDAACLIFGRRFVVRGSRFALNRARLDLENSMEDNGEVSLQASIFADPSQTHGYVVFDVGANIGEWSESLTNLAKARRAESALSLHAFEPSSDTFLALQQRLVNRNVTLNNVGVSNVPGVMELYVVGKAAGTNSMHQASHSMPTLAVETVPVTTIDDYVSERGIEFIDLLKIDTEGHDFHVLLGARHVLSQKRVGVVQFEYNHRWIAARSYLRDVFDLVLPLGYEVGKLTARGVEAYPQGWTHDLETFIEGNYVCYRNTEGHALPTIAHWSIG